MSLGTLSVFPPEILRKICTHLPLEDSVMFGQVHSILHHMLPNIFFRDMKKLHLDWNSNGVTLTWTGNSLKSSFSITSASKYWQKLIEYVNHVEEILITKTDDAKNYAVLDLISKKCFKLKNLEIRLRKGKRMVSKHTMGYSYAKLTSFVGQHRHHLNRFRLETSSDNFVLFESRPEATFRFSHEYNMVICNQLIIPLFNCMLKDRLGMTSVTLQVDCRSKADLVLQSAFQAALPYEHRINVQILRLEFGNSVSTLSEQEMHQVLAAYAPYLNSTRNLQHLICDLSHSMLDPGSLEKLYSVISEELCNKQHRISIITSSENLPRGIPSTKCWTKQVLVS